MSIARHELPPAPRRRIRVVPRAKSDPFPVTGRGTFRPRSLLVPNLALASEQARKNFRLRMSADLRHIFDQLVKMIENPVQDLPWYHRLGTIVASLRNTSERSIPMNALEEALGPCSSVLAKSCRFVKEYPGDEDLRSLSKTGTTWTLLTLAFSIKKQTDRHRILREAVINAWSPRELYAQIHLRFPTGRRGMGGGTAR